ncbi:acyl carrier protein [Allorhizocola rhizosphaerae]|uniref:acyl carrier protein n=1 Tax=Allorhizocola rhizosphaerae TaxID=1872709 RepID=UPI001FEA5523|nr:acyl carrier protein [Allorhizocola rhizosphaerae]
MSIVRLRSLPLSERREALESMIIAVLKSSLLMGEDEQLSTSESFFDMGLTSLQLTEAKEHLEAELACQISATVVFNNPTIDSMTHYLADEVLPDLFIESAHGDTSGEPPEHRALWDDVMRDVCGK